MRELEVAAYARRRLVVALRGLDEPPPAILRPLLLGSVVSGLLVAVVTVGRVW